MSLLVMRKNICKKREPQSKPVTRQCVPIFNSNTDLSVEQCYAIKFCMLLKKNTVETILLLQVAFGNEVLGVLMIKRWHKMFLNGRELAKFEPWYGKPKIVFMVTNINSFTTAIEDNSHQPALVAV